MYRLLAQMFVVPLLFCGIAAPAFAAKGDGAAKLNVGDPAPALSLSKFVKGEPVKSFEKGKVYVVEFWATWCGPCKVSIPHVTKLQEKFKDKGLTVIGVDIWERDISKVEPFVAEMGDKMNYTVAIEEPIAPAEGLKPSAMPRGKMATNWMAAANQNGIPCSFIVDKESKVAWVGHPMKMEKPLTAIIAGTYDAKAQAELDDKIEGLEKKAAEAMRDKDYDGALKIRDQIIALAPEEAASQQSRKMMLFYVKGDADAANKLAGELIENAVKDKEGTLAAQTASMMLNAPNAGEKSDKVLALKAAQFAYDNSDKGLAYQRLLAQALAANKQYDKAIELQTKVVEKITGPMKDREQKLLDEYKKSAGQI